MNNVKTSNGVEGQEIDKNTVLVRLVLHWESCYGVAHIKDELWTTLEFYNSELAQYLECAELDTLSQVEDEFEIYLGEVDGKHSECSSDVYITVMPYFDDVVLFSPYDNSQYIVNNILETFRDGVSTLEECDEKIRLFEAEFQKSIQDAYEVLRLHNVMSEVHCVMPFEKALEASYD